jgi:hypothetical protein
MHERMTDKTRQPSEAEMLETIGQTLAPAWDALRQFLEDTYQITPTCDSGGRMYGWNLQYRRGGRPLCEMYPEHGSFTALVILGKAELEQAVSRLDTFGQNVQWELMEAPRYHDGAWMYIRVADPHTSQQDVEDIQQLILIKKKPIRRRTT